MDAETVNPRAVAPPVAHRRGLRTFRLAAVTGVLWNRAEAPYQGAASKKLAGRDGRGRIGGSTNQHAAVGSHYSGCSAYGHGVLPFDVVGYHNGAVDWSGRWKAPSVYKQFVLTFKALMCESQCFVREANGGERSSVSSGCQGIQMVPEVRLAASTSSDQDTEQIQVTKEL